MAIPAGFLATVLGDVLGYAGANVAVAPPATPGGSPTFVPAPGTTYDPTGAPKGDGTKLTKAQKNKFTRLLIGAAIGVGVLILSVFAFLTFRKKKKR